MQEMDDLVTRLKTNLEKAEVIEKSQQEFNADSKLKFKDL
jgi:hypothetical protein